jgi:hypothetical protein
MWNFHFICHCLFLFAAMLHRDISCDNIFSQIKMYFECSRCQVMLVPFLYTEDIFEKYKKLKSTQNLFLYEDYFYDKDRCTVRPQGTGLVELKACLYRTYETSQTKIHVNAKKLITTFH